MMKYFVNICKLHEGEQKCTEVDCCRNIFWQKEIEISKNFYFELSENREVMLIPRIHRNDNMIINFNRYFKKAIEFRVIRSSVFSERSILICELQGYFEPDDENYKPF